MHGHAKSTNGKKESPTYNSWRSMIQRCTNPNHVHYSQYKDLGIDLRWLDFSSFLEDMGLRPVGMTLERINNNHGYSKKNCRWASAKEQQRNKRNTVLSLELAASVRLLRSEGFKIKDIASELGLNKSTVTNVLYRGNWT